jgi:hypothetical protein
MYLCARIQKEKRPLLYIFFPSYLTTVVNILSVIFDHSCTYFVCHIWPLLYMFSVSKRKETTVVRILSVIHILTHSEKERSSDIVAIMRGNFVYFWHTHTCTRAHMHTRTHAHTNHMHTCKYTRYIFMVGMSISLWRKSWSIFDTHTHTHTHTHQTHAYIHIDIPRTAFLIIFAVARGKFIYFGRLRRARIELFGNQTDNLLCMYVCMYDVRHVCMHMIMYVCMYEAHWKSDLQSIMYVRTYLCTKHIELIGNQTDNLLCTCVCMYACTKHMELIGNQTDNLLCMYVCMYVCMYACTSLRLPARMCVHVCVFYSVTTHAIVYTHFVGHI